jgi:high affinity cGMP-specific 3',5'-cyclic phosphodiesterase 9
MQSGINPAKTQSLTVKQSLIDSKLSEIATALQGFKELSGLKEQMNTLQTKLNETEKNMSMSQYVRPIHTPATAVKRLSKIDPRFQSQHKYIFTPETTSYLKTPSFNNWQWEENEMTALLEHMFFELGLVDHYKIELPVLKRFLSTVKDNYNLNPFHNFRHCFCVTQMVKLLQLHNLDVWLAKYHRVM